MTSPDVCIIGSGIVGLASAYHLKQDNRNLEIMVIDKGKTYAQGNTGRSAAGFRDMFSSRTNYLLSSSSVSFYRHIQEEEHFDLGMKFVGYLFLVGENERTERMRELAKSIPGATIVDRSGLPKGFAVLDPDKEASKILNLDPVSFAVFGKNCGIVEPDLICQYYYERLLDMGVTFSFGTRVEKIHLDPVEKLDYPGEPFVWQEKKLGPLSTDKGEISAEKYILAADTWSDSLLDPLGVDTHTRPKKRQIFQVSGDGVEKILATKGFNDYGLMPFTILPSHGIYLRPAPKEKSVWIGVSDEIGRDFSRVENPEAEEGFYENNIFPVIEQYFPSIAKGKVTSKWAGYYSYNTIDQNPYVFPVLNGIVATGTTGSGILKADALGRVTAAACTGKKEAVLYGGARFEVESLGVANRKVDIENFVL